VTNNNRFARRWLALLLPLCLIAAQAGTPALIRDINTTVWPADSSPKFIGTLGSLSLYSATVDGVWRLVGSDGTPDGAYIVQNFDGSGVFTNTPYKLLFQVGSKAYFAAHQQATGVELWVTDGRADGTRQVADLAPGSVGSFPQFLGAFDGKLVFNAMRGDGTRQVYITDGTTAGTAPLTDFPATPGTHFQDEFAAAGGKFYFITWQYNCGTCTYVWVSNGTAAGTHAMPEFGGSGIYQQPWSLSAVGTRVLLAGASASRATLFSIDTATEAVSLLDIPDSGPISRITVLNGHGYFVGRFNANSEEVWRSDGTLSGIEQVTNIQLSPQSGSVSFDGLYRIGDRLVFPAKPNNSANALQLWSTNGTPGDQAVLTALPGITHWDFTSIPKTARHLQLRAFAGSASTLISTDGTPAGTRILPTTFEGQALTFLNLVGDATAEYLRYSTPGPNNTTIYSLFQYTPAGTAELTPLRTSTLNDLGQLSMSVSNGALLFNSTDSTHGSELWISDPAGTRLLSNLNPEINNSGSFPWYLTEWDGRAVFVTFSGVNRDELWVSDGTSAGTSELWEIAASPSQATFRNLMVLDGALFFFASDGTTSRFMKLMPGSSTPVELATLAAQVGQWNGPPPVQGRCGGANHAILANKLYFPASGAHGSELWVTDGTVAGTREVADIHPAGDSTPCDFTVMNNRLYFGADGGPGNGGIELWSTDGTASGTQRVADLAPGDAHSSPQSLVPMNGHLYFVATLGQTNHLLRTDGTEAGMTYLEPVGNTRYFDAYPIGVLNGRLILFKPTGFPQFSPYEVWSSDGTSAGTVRIPEVLAEYWRAPLFTGTSLYFANVAEATDVEPWITDGTAAGTRQVADLETEQQYSSFGFMEFRGRVVMSKDSLRNGSLESVLWQTDGTPQGTTRLGVSGWPDSLGYSENPGYLVIGQNLVYSAELRLTGSELHVLPNDRPVAVNDTASASATQPATINVLGNDSDTEGTLDPATLRIVQRPAHGSVDIGPNGTIIYRPEAGFTGTDTFTYAVSDRQGYESPVATVSVTSSSNGKRRGGGALQWWTVLMLALLAVSAARARALRPHRLNR